MNSENGKKNKIKQVSTSALKQKGGVSGTKKQKELSQDKPEQEKKYDKHKREILDCDFENQLRMSKNSLKLNYSRLKNFINSYKYIKSRLEDQKEIFYKGQNTVLVLKIGADRLLVYCRLPKNSLDKERFPHREVKNKEFEKTPILLTVQSQKALENAQAVIEIVMEVNELQKMKKPSWKNYAQMYPFIKNAVLKGNEHKPPKKGEGEGEEYEDIENERALIKGVPKRTRTKTSQPPLKQTAETVKEAIALSEPIVFYYDVAMDRASEVIFVNSQMVINDKFLGKMLPQQYYAIAESSDRAEKLDLIAVEMAVKDCELKTDTDFLVNVSCRHLFKKDKLKKLIETATTPNGNLILGFDCVYLNALGSIGKEANQKIKEAGIKFLVYNGEQAGIEVLTEYYLDYISLDSRYYPLDNPKAMSHLEMITGYCKVQGIGVVMRYVKAVKDALKYFSLDINGVQGTAVGQPKRLAATAIRDRKLLPNNSGG